MKEVSQDTIEAFVSLFKGRTDAHGQVNECIYEPVTLKHYEKHLKGEVNLGIYFVLDDSTCHFAAIDLDEKDFNKAKAMRDELTRNSIPAYITESKSKGFHVYCFAATRFKAVEIRRVLRHILNKLSIKAEVFPKQDYHQPDDSDGTRHPGSYINLPCFGYTRPFLSGDLKEVPLEVALQRIKRVPQEAIDRALQTIPAETPQEEPVTEGRKRQKARLPCFEKMMAGVPEGCRDEVTFRLAVHLHRQGMPQQLAEATLLEWDANYNRPAIGSTVIRQKIRQAYTGKYGLGCLNDLILPFCEQDCPVYRKRHTEIDQRKQVGGKEIEIMGLTRLGTTPPSFGLAIDGSQLTLSPGDLLSLRKVKAKAIETLSYVPFPGMKPSEWEVLVNSLLTEVAEEAAPPDASVQARYIECLYEWLEVTPQAERPEDVEAGRPVKRDGGYFFRMKDAVSYLFKHHRLNVEPNELYRMVKAADGDAQSIRLGKVFRLWSLPVRGEEEGPQIDMEV
ncbi:hypothetical protein ACFLVE_02455 [Chloroflexota bacterium]